MQHAFFLINYVKAFFTFFENCNYFLQIKFISITKSSNFTDHS